MPQMKNYPTRLYTAVTGDEYVVVTDLSEAKTYKLNLTEYVTSVASGAADSMAQHLLQYDHADFVTVDDLSLYATLDQLHFHSNKANLDTIDQDLGTVYAPTFADGSFVINDTGCIVVKSNPPVYIPYSSPSWADFTSFISNVSGADVHNGIMVGSWQENLTDYGYAYIETYPYSVSYLTKVDNDGAVSQTNTYSSSSNCGFNTNYDNDCYITIQTGTTGATIFSLADNNSKGFYLNNSDTQTGLAIVGGDPFRTLSQISPYNFFGSCPYLLDTAATLTAIDTVLSVKNNNTDVFTIFGGGSIQTAAPSGSTAQPWKLGSHSTGGGALNGGYVVVEVHGQVYKLGVVS